MVTAKLLTGSRRFVYTALILIVSLGEKALSLLSVFSISNALTEVAGRQLAGVECRQ